VKKRAFVFDSYALLKLFQKEKGYEGVVRILRDIGRRRLLKYINAINLGEILYTTKREFVIRKGLRWL